MSFERRLFLLLGLLTLFTACSDDQGPLVDTRSPAAVTDLRVDEIGTTYVELAWTATGDDGKSGTASEYDIRFGGSYLDDSGWEAAGRCDHVPAPEPAGTGQTYRVEPLIPKTQYYFALRAADEAGNWSGISNVATAFAAGQDSVAPFPITDLWAQALNQTSVRLTWTATGDDTSQGTAAAYDLRYSTASIDMGNWSSATKYDQEPLPRESASPETLVLADLAPDTQYFFAVMVVDEAVNWSDLSNIASALTPAWPDTIPPAAVNDLMSTGSGLTSITLTWTAPGDDGTMSAASAYDIRYSISPVDESNWPSANQCTGEPAPLPAGARETYTAEGLTPATTYYFAIKVGDEVRNWSDLSNLLEASTQGAALDSTPPAPVEDLDAAIFDAFKAHLRWTATGDDGHEGTALEYDIRFHTAPIDTANWVSATMAEGEPGPAEDGTIQTFKVGGLSASTRYYFAMRVRDEVSNWSAISNYDSVVTPSCPYGGPTVFGNLQAHCSTPYSMWLQWEEYKGDPFAPSVFDIRYSESPIDDWNWEFATRSPGQPDREDVGNHWWYFSCRIENLNAATTYYVGIRGTDSECLSSLVTASATTEPITE